MSRDIRAPEKGTAGAATGLGMLSNHSFSPQKTAESLGRRRIALEKDRVFLPLRGA